jgi:hypothetical protein
MTLMSQRALNRAYLARQMLLAREQATALQAVERLVAMQAQVPRPPFIGLWTRLHGFKRSDLADAFHARTVVRVTSLRGTLHVMTTADYIALRGALQPMLSRGMLAILRDRAGSLDMDVLNAEARKFFRKSAATFDTLRDHLKAKFPTHDERAMAYAIRTHLPLVQVPTDAMWAFPASADFALADTWLSTTVSTASMPAEALVLRYLAAFGPATAGDAQAWSGMAGLRDTFESLRPRLVTFRDARKRELFDLPDAPRPDEDTAAPVRFIPEFDNLVLSHDDRSRIIADEHRSRVTLKNLQVRATFLVDGIVAGTWKSERKRKAAVLLIEPFGTVARRNRVALEEEAELLLAFLEEEATEREVRWVS